MRKLGLLLVVVAATASGQAAAEVIRYGIDDDANINRLPQVVAEREGLFAHEGLTVEVIPFTVSFRAPKDARPITLRQGMANGDIDILASGADASLMDRFIEYEGVERVLAHGDTKSSVRLTGGFQADLRLVAAGYYAGEDIVARRGLSYHNRDVVSYVARIRATYVMQAGVADDLEKPTSKRVMR